MTTYALTGNVLTDGQWVRDGLVWRWVANVHPEPEPKIAADYRPHDLIACPTCHARMDEKCRGDKRAARGHKRRLVKRVCSCGGPVRAKEPMCGFCRAELAVGRVA